jgi:predicted transcriptional regulator
MEETLTIRLDAQLAARLRREAKRRNTSKGEVVRTTLRRGLDQKAPSAGELLAGLHGIVKGPRDLATNKTHLKDFGRTKQT